MGNLNMKIFFAITLLTVLAQYAYSTSCTATMYCNICSSTNTCGMCFGWHSSSKNPRNLSSNTCTATLATSAQVSGVKYYLGKTDSNTWTYALAVCDGKY